MKQRYLAILILIVAAAVAYFFFKSKKPGSTENNKVKVGILSWPGCGALYVGQEKGFFKEEGVDLDIQFIENFDSRRAALIAGQIDVDYTTIDQVLIYHQAKFNVQIFGVCDMSNGADGIIAKNEIKTFSDLKGKTIAYGEASPNEFVLRYFLKQNSISINDVKLKPVADAQIAGNAILAGQVDAAVTFEPFLTQSKQNSNLHILSSSREYPELIPGLFVGNKIDLNKRKDVYLKFMKAWYRTVEYINSNKAESFGMISKKMNLPLNELEPIMQNILLAKKEENVKAFTKSNSNNLFQLTKLINQFWLESKIVTNIFNEDDLINSNTYGGE